MVTPDLPGHHRSARGHFDDRASGQSTLWGARPLPTPRNSPITTQPRTETSTRTDVELILAAREGDASAAEALVSRYLDDIRRFLWARTSDADLANDLTQDVFVRALSTLHRFEDLGAGRIGPWLHRIAVNLVADHYRSADVRRRGSAEVPEFEAVDGEPDVGMLRDEDARRVRAALATLSPSHQLVLTLRFLEDRSLEEAALSMGRSAAAVSTLTHRAITALQRALVPRTGTAQPAPAVDRDRPVHRRELLLSRLAKAPPMAS